MKLFIFLVAICVLAGCKHTEYVTVPVETIHTIEHHHTDSIYKRDSVVVEKETVVMELDSASMQEYGIRLKQTERAWLVKTRELENRLKEISSRKTDTLLVRDSVPVVVEKVIEKKLTAWQKYKMRMGGLFLFLLLVAIVVAGFFTIRKVNRYRELDE